MSIVDFFFSIYSERFSEDLRNVNWDTLTEEYKKFLEAIPLQEYREKLQQIKTVEFNLSGKYRSLHLSLIYHFYLKKKFLVANSGCDSLGTLKNERMRALLSKVCGGNTEIELFKLLDSKDFKNEEKIFDFIFNKSVGRGRNKKRVSDYLRIRWEYVSSPNFPSFEEFWSKYLMCIDIEDFISQHKSYIDLESIRNQIQELLENHSSLLEDLVGENSEYLELSSFDTFVKLYLLVGLKSRLYRTWTAVLTQLDFVYTWNKFISEIKVDSETTLDIKGIDIYCVWNGRKIGFQIKKESQRHEARRLPRGVARDLLLEDIVYSVNPENNEKLEDKLDKLSNGFVVFNENYVNSVFNSLQDRIRNQEV